MSIKQDYCYTHPLGRGLIKLFLLLLFAGFSTLSTLSQPSLLTLDRIYNSSEFDGERFGPARWLDEGVAYTTVEASPGFQDALDIIHYQTRSGLRTVLIGAGQLIPEGTTKPLRIEDYEWSHDKSKLLIYTNSKKVWRRNTRGDYWVLDLETGSLKQLGKDFPAASLMFAKFSPDDKKVAFVSRHNVYVEQIGSGMVIALTADGHETLINGTFDWAYEEEFAARDGFRWSPDGNYIAYWQVDASAIKEFLMINNTDSLYPFNVPLQYPKVGEDPSRCRIGIIPVTGGVTTWVPIPGDQKQNYLPRMMWGPDSETLLVQQIPRKQNTNRIWSYSLKDGAVQNIHTDHDEAWVRAVDDWMWLNQGKEFSWLSEKDGWNHLYRVSARGDGEQLVTKGAYDVVNIVLIDDDNGYLYFIASPDNPTQRYLFRTRLDGRGKLEKLSPDNQPGDHSYEVAPDGKFAIHTYSSANTPPIIDLVALPSHKSIRVLVENEQLKNNFYGLKKSDIEFFKITTEDQVQMDGYMIRPPDFDASKQYPVLFYVYGEPAGQTARDRWGGSRNLWHLMLAQQGYVIVTMDNRGTPSPKGRTWRKSIFREIGVLNARDQAMAAKEILKYDFIDKDRVGVWGWSGGGSMTLNLLFQYPDLYQAGMSIAPVANQLLYDNIYQERYMGVPWETKEDFIKGSPITHAGNLKGDLLLVHGTGDDNVHYQNSEVLINELVKHNKQFQLMSYPNRTHSIREGENTTRHLFGLLTKFLNEHIAPGGAGQTTLKKD